MPDAERRGEPRIDRRFMVRYCCPALGQPQWMLSPIKDISITGLRFISERGFPPGTELELELQLPTSPQPVPVTGIVAWDRNRGLGPLAELGVRFARIEPHTKAQLEQLTQFFLRKKA